jgi:subtilisin family serine protease
VSEIRAEALDRATAKGLRILGPDELSYKRGEYARVKQEGLEGLHSVTVLRDFENFSSSFVRVSSEDALNSLLERPEVKAIYENRKLRIGTNESLPLIEQPAVAIGGLDGTGTVVAVLDTGVYYPIEPFNCTAPGMPTGVCRVAATFEATVDINGNPTDDGSLDDDGHGTNVSAIVARTAADADLAVADVCSDAYGCDSVNMLNGMEWVADLKNSLIPPTFNVVSMNISMWVKREWEYWECQFDPLAGPMQDILALGIQPIGITGNGGTYQEEYTYGASWPGCLPSMVSVGAVFDDNFVDYTYETNDDFHCVDSPADKDTIPCFSQTFGDLDLYAPGVWITSAGSPVDGTSFAAPHVAGAWAIMREFMPAATELEILTALKDGGDLIDDPRFSNAPDVSRINLRRTILPEPSQLLALSSGILALWGLSILRVRDRGLGQ